MCTETCYQIKLYYYDDNYRLILHAHNAKLYSRVCVSTRVLPSIKLVLYGLDGACDFIKAFTSALLPCAVIKILIGTELVSSARLFQVFSLFLKVDLKSFQMIVPVLYSIHQQFK